MDLTIANVDQALNSWLTPHVSLLNTSYGVSFGDILNLGLQRCYMINVASQLVSNLRAYSKAYSLHEGPAIQKVFPCCKIIMGLCAITGWPPLLPSSNPCIHLIFHLNHAVNLTGKPTCLRSWGLEKIAIILPIKLSKSLSQNRSVCILISVLQEICAFRFDSQ